MHVNATTVLRTVAAHLHDEGRAAAVRRARVRELLCMPGQDKHSAARCAVRGSSGELPLDNRAKGEPNRTIRVLNAVLPIYECNQYN